MKARCLTAALLDSAFGPLWLPSIQSSSAKGRREGDFDQVWSDRFAHETAYVPNDPLILNQWHLIGSAYVDINITEAWNFYSGKNIKFGVYDDGVDHDHPDLSGNYNSSLHVVVNGVFDNPTIYNAGDAHGTSVAGLIAARAGNGKGGVGGSFDGLITGVDIFGNGGTAYLFGAMNQQDRFDVTNHSWGWVGAFADNRLDNNWAQFFLGLADAASNGRSGLGTIQMVAAGNDRDSFENTNTSNFTSSRFVNAIAAITDYGQIASYSTPGASLLISSPSNGGSRGIITTDYSGSLGYSSGDYTSTFGGTSAATPIASGVVGLILEANPNLGYRDVTEILAVSARQMGDPGPSGYNSAYRPWQMNGATNWNNGGMHFSHDYGFGLIDAFAAVKLAESWDQQQKFSNEIMVSASNSIIGTVPDNNITGISRIFNLTPLSGSPISIEAIEVQINWATKHTYAGDLIIELISPDGTTSYLLDHSASSADLGNWIFMSRAHLGELATGNWIVRVTDEGQGDTGTISSISLRAYGSQDVDDRYFYTDEFGGLRSTVSERDTLSDSDGGTDTINLAALSMGASIHLTPGVINTIAGSTFIIADGTLIEDVIGTWSNDVLEGNNIDNFVDGSLGNDTLYGHGGSDRFIGGEGSDIINGGDGSDYYYFDAQWDQVEWVIANSTVTMTFLDPIMGVDVVSDVEYFVDSHGNQKKWQELSGAPLSPLAPTIVSFSDNSGSIQDNITSDQMPTITINAQFDVETVEVYVRDQSHNLVSQGSAIGEKGVFTFTPSFKLSDGDYYFTAIASRHGLNSEVSAYFRLAVDSSAPNLISLTPLDGAINVSPSANLIIQFSENIVLGSGQLNLWLSSNDMLVHSFSSNSTEISVVGNQLMINPSFNLPSGQSIYVTMDEGFITDSAGNFFAGIETKMSYDFVTSSQNIITGNNNANTLTGSSGNDIVYGYGGNDRIFGNDGDDIIDGGAQNDSLNGGNHASIGDTVSYSSATALVTVSLAITKAQKTGGSGTDTLTGFENLIGSDYNDRLTGSNGSNQILGGLGNDIITGGNGIDYLWGGQGFDVFDFNAVSETTNTFMTCDVIMDFEQGADKIDFSTIDASSIQRKNNSFIFRGESSIFGTGSDGEISYEHVYNALFGSAVTVIYCDIDADSASEFQIILNGIYDLTGADFYL